MTNPIRPNHSSGFTRINDLGRQGHGSSPQTPANSDAQPPQDASSSAQRVRTIRTVRIPFLGVPVLTTKEFKGAAASSNPTDGLSPDSSPGTAAEPLLTPQAPAAAPQSYRQYCAQWDAWKNEAHPSSENRTEAVKRMQNLGYRERSVDPIAEKLLAAAGKSIPRKEIFGQTLDLSSLGLSSLPPWIPKVTKVNLDNNMLESFPTDLLTHLTDTRKGRAEIRLTNNPLPSSELNKLQSITDSSEYQGPKLVLPRPGQSHEPPQLAQGTLV